jgi:hypothetical protein
MSINPIGSPNIGGVDPNINAGKVKKTDTFEGKKISSASSPDTNAIEHNMNLKSNVESHSLEAGKAAEGKNAIAKTSDAKEAQGTKSVGNFMGLKIGQGIHSKEVHDKLSGKHNVDHKDLDNRA